MEDTTDKPGAPAAATGEETLDDKDDGQAPHGTGESQDGSNPSDDAPAEGSDDVEDTADDQTTSEDEGSEGDTEEESLLTPEEIAKLPPELKAQYRSMNKRFQERMREAREIEQRGKLGADDAEGDASPNDRIIDAALKRRGIDPAKLTPDQRQSIDLIVDIANEVSGRRVAPIEQERLNAEVQGYFTKFPDRAKFRKDMAKLDAATGERMTLDQLYYAVSGQDREAAEKQRRDKKLRNLQGSNADSSTGTAGTDGEGDIFDEIATAGGHGNSILL